MPVWLTPALSLLKGVWDFLAKLGPLLAFWKLGRDGKELEADRRTQNAVKDKEEIREDIARDDDAGRDKRLSRWFRD